MASCTSGVITVKTDYTITPEYDAAADHKRLALMCAAQQNAFGRESPEYMALIQRQSMHDDRPASERQVYGMQNVNYFPVSSGQAGPAAMSGQAVEWLEAYAEARRSHAACEPLIRTVCKIATRIVLVLLIVGIAVGVMV